MHSHSCPAWWTSGAPASGTHAANDKTTVTVCNRDVNSPARPLMLSSAVSLPPVGSLTTLRSDIDMAVASGAPSLGLAGVATRASLSTPPSPHQAETPTLHQHPTSPFALHSGVDHSGGPSFQPTHTPVKSSWLRPAAISAAHCSPTPVLTLELLCPPVSAFCRACFDP